VRQASRSFPHPTRNDAANVSTGRWCHRRNAPLLDAIEAGACVSIPAVADRADDIGEGDSEETKELDSGASERRSLGPLPLV